MSMKNHSSTTPTLWVAFFISICLAATGSSAEAQKSFPGWSAPKLIPTTSTRATYPDIFAEGDIIHVVFRATFTTQDEVAESEVQLDALLTEIQRLDYLRRFGSRTDRELAGGDESLKKQRDDLMKKYTEIRDSPAARSQVTTAPIQTSLFYTRSEDRGKTFWEEPIRITDDPEYFYGETALHVDSEGIHVAYTGERGDNIIRVYTAKSTDGGKTWSSPTRVSSSEYQAFGPYFAAIPRGILLCWWELEETQTEELRRRDFEMMDDLIEQVQVGNESQQAQRSVIKYSRNIAGTWENDQFLANARGAVPAVSASVGQNGEVYVYWVDDNGPQMMVSRSGGIRDSWEKTLDFAQVLDPDHHTVFLWDGENYRFIRGEEQRRRSTTLEHREGLLRGDWNATIEQQAQHSFPRIDFTKDEVQVIWGVTDPSGDHIMYYREDNKPPTSELIFPPDGDFTKHALTFIWRGLDDIATRLTYRHSIMKRAKPSDQPEPFNWSLYEAEDDLAIKPLEDGYYTLYVQATDFSGNEETVPSKFNFQTYFVPPSVTMEKESLPPLQIETRNIEVKWTASDNNPTEEELLLAYRLDGNPVTPFSPRKSVRIEGLLDGWHQVQLFVKDELGNVSPFGETLTVSVNLDLQLYWKQIPVQPQQDGVVFLKDDRVNLSWGIRENTNDQGIEYMSSIRLTHDGQDGPWSPPQFNPDAELSGQGNTPLEEGAYIVTVLAQDEYGNMVDGYIQHSFTVDHTPPTIAFNEPSIDPESKIPTISVTGTDNYTTPGNIVYQFKINEGTASEVWSNWSPDASFVCAGNPIKWYSWGYTVEARAQDVAGNIMPQPAISDALLWYRRSPWMLYTLVALAAFVVIGLLFLVISALVERRRARKRSVARKKKLEEADEGAVAPTAAATDDELFDVGGGSGAVTQKAPAGDDFFGGAAPLSSPGMGASPMDDPFGGPSSGSRDPFASNDTVVFDDPFADKSGPVSPLDEPTPLEDPFASSDEDEPLSIGGGQPKHEPDPFASPEQESGPSGGFIPSDEDEPLTIGGAPPSPPPAPEPPPPKTWSPDKDVELDERDLYDPLN
jgi:hypothetical protein